MSKVKARRNQSEVNEASDLLRWLNGELTDSQAYLGKPTKASRSRVANLLREINDTAAALVVMDEQNPDLDYFDFPEPQMEERVNRIQEMLNDYPRWPTVEVAFNNNAAILHFDYANGGQRPLGEQVAVWALTDLASKGAQTWCANVAVNAGTLRDVPIRRLAPQSAVIRTMSKRTNSSKSVATTCANTTH